MNEESIETLLKNLKDTLAKKDQKQQQKKEELIDDKSSKVFYLKESMKVKPSSNFQPQQNHNNETSMFDANKFLEQIAKKEISSILKDPVFMQKIIGDFLKSDEGKKVIHNYLKENESMIKEEVKKCVEKRINSI